MLLITWKRRRVLRRAKKVFQSSGVVDEAGAVLLLAFRRVTETVVASGVWLGLVLLEKCAVDGEDVQAEAVTCRRWTREETREPQGRVAVERQAVG